MLDQFIKLIRQWIDKGIYVWGGQGETITSETQIRRMETSTLNADRAIRLWKSRGSNAVAFDCSGLIVWALQELKLIDYDTTANGMYRMSASINKSDLRVGDFVFRVDNDGRAYHVGIVTGSVNSALYVTEARGRDYGVVEEHIDAVRWNKFGRNPWIKTIEGSDTVENLKNGSRGEDVRILQANLNKLGYAAGTADGIFGSRTETAVKAFQKDKGLTADGIAGAKTQAAISAALTPPAPTEPPAVDYKALSELQAAQLTAAKDELAGVHNIIASLNADLQALAKAKQIENDIIRKHTS